MASMSRPAGRTSWTGGPIDAGTDARMCTKAVRHDMVSGVAKSTKY